MTNKLYTTPETEVLEVRFEENFCGTFNAKHNTETFSIVSQEDDL